jgi:hypothetical protein
MPADTAAAFFAAMSELQEEFATAAVEIEEREATLKTALAHVRHLLRDGVGDTVLAPSHTLARFLADFNGELADILQHWVDQIEKHDRNTAFRKGFTDSLVVFVLGKVKSGKSSLGNYMAYGRSNPEGVTVTGGRPHFFTAAMAQGAEDDVEAAVGQGGFFRVGARETTKSIQGFRISGLTWVDSPGLHSVTPENGALASDYADVADLIVYPMHSGNPGRAGDLSEIRELLTAKKRFLVIITQCDRTEEDEAPDGTIAQLWVMKDRAARQGQIDYVRHALAKGGDSPPFEILSLSVRYAETHENDPIALEESGLADFFRLLSGIARSEGVRHKRETPSRNLNRFVDLLLSDDACGSPMSVARVLTQVRALEERLASTSAELDHRAKQVTARVLGSISPMVADQIERHAVDKNQMGFERGCTIALGLIVAEEIRAEILSLLANTGGALVPIANLGEISGFMQFESLTVKIPKSNRKMFGVIGKAGGTLAGAWVGAEMGAVAGSVVPGIGSVIGFSVGATLGALLGGLGGDAAGKALGSDWDVSMQSGVNRAAVEASAIKTLQNVSHGAVEGFFASLKSAAITPVNQRAARLVHALAQFSEVLRTKVYSNGRSVPPRV